MNSSSAAAIWDWCRVRRRPHCLACGRLLGAAEAYQRWCLPCAAAGYTWQRTDGVCAGCGGRLTRQAVATGFQLLLCPDCPTPEWVSAIAGPCRSCRGGGETHLASCPDHKACNEYLARACAPPIPPESARTCYKRNCPHCGGTGRRNGLRRPQAVSADGAGNGRLAAALGLDRDGA